VPTVAASASSSSCSNVAILEFIYHTTEQKLEPETMQQLMIRQYAAQRQVMVQQ